MAVAVCTTNCMASNSTMVAVTVLQLWIVSVVISWERSVADDRRDLLHVWMTVNSTTDWLNSDMAFVGDVANRNQNTVVWLHVVASVIQVAVNIRHPAQLIMWVMLINRHT